LRGERGDDQREDANALAMLRNGRQIFRYDTFGDQAFWGDTLKLHQAIAGANLGGVGPGVGPSTALAVGLKVDMDALPESLKRRLADGDRDRRFPGQPRARQALPHDAARRLVCASQGRVLP